MENRASVNGKRGGKKFLPFCEYMQDALVTILFWRGAVPSGPESGSLYKVEMVPHDVIKETIRTNRITIRTGFEIFMFIVVSLLPDSYSQVALEIANR